MNDNRTPNYDSSPNPVVETKDSGQPVKRESKRSHKSGPLLALIGAGKPDFESIEEIDAFIRAERATWNS